MTSSHRPLAVMVALAAACALVLPAGTAAAATKNPCKLVKASEISEVFGQPVAKPKTRLSTAVSKQCQFKVSATTDKPDGSVATYLQFVGAKIAFDTDRKQLEASSVSGLGKDAFYQDTGATGGVVWVLKGDVLLTVQGIFLSIGSGPAADPAVLKDELVAVAKIARKRA
jgi:hypothetical protein